jgi:outer membrane protein OmpA-like peptidoglycan-associated protein
MYFSTKKIMLAALLATMFFAGATHAAEPGFFVGASGGQSYIDDEIDNRNIDDDDTGWKAYLGYNFLPWLGIEAGYVSFGTYSSNELFEGTNFDAEVDVTGWDGFLVGYLPMGSVDLFAKVGAIDLSTELNTRNFGTDSNTDTQLAYGVGLAWNIGNWALRAEAEGFDDNEVDDFYFVSAGVTYTFASAIPEPVAAAAPVAAPAKCPDSDGDGVCDADDQCPNTAPGTRVSTLGCDCDYTLQLQFAFDSAQLTAADKAELDRLVPILSNPKSGSIGGVIEGHTDSIGTAEYNMGLSQRRAESVERYLEAQGVSLAGRFTSEAFGKTKPIASNDTAEGRAENRRVVIRRTDCD